MPTEAGGRIDGRIDRGIRRRRRLLDAALRVIERDGVAGATYRAVAEEAGLPKTSATYYFATAGEMLRAALAHSAAEYGAELRRLLGAGQSTADLARYLAHFLARNRGRTLAEYELYLLAARRPELRPAARQWSVLAEQTAALYTGDPTAITAFALALDGLAIQTLLRDEPADEREIQAILDHILVR